MAFRGRGRGRGGRGFGGGGGYVKQEPFELFPPVIGQIGTAEYSDAKLQLIRWSGELQRLWKSSPYFYQDKSLLPEKEKAEKPDIERYSDRFLPQTNVKLELRDWIILYQDHVPAELAEGGRKRRPKRIKWNADLGKDIFDKLEKMSEGKEEETEKKEDEEEEEEEDENEEGEGEISDEGDYEQPCEYDDDEDDYNMADEGNDEDTFFEFWT